MSASHPVIRPGGNPGGFDLAMRWVFELFKHNVTVENTTLILFFALLGRDGYPLHKKAVG
jgi:hypothetical protein